MSRAPLHPNDALPTDLAGLRLRVSGHALGIFSPKTMGQARVTTTLRTYNSAAVAYVVKPSAGQPPIPPLFYFS